MLSCEKGASPYKDADKVSGSIKEISFKREIPCEDGYMGCYDYTVCEENKVEKTFTDDVEICADLGGLVLDKCDYLNAQFSLELPEEVSDEFLVPIEEYSELGNGNISDKSAKIAICYFVFYRDDEDDSSNSIEYLSCISSSDDLVYTQGVAHDYATGECVETGEAWAHPHVEIYYIYSDSKVSVKGENVDIKLKKGWNKVAFTFHYEMNGDACNSVIYYSYSTDNIPSDCEWVIIDNNENKR